MAIANGVIRSIIGGEDPHKVVDQKAYNEALEKSGYTREEAQRYWENPTNADPYSALGKEISMASKVQVPQVSIKNNEVHISAPKAMWESPVVKQLQKELQSLKGVDLSNAEVNNAIKSLNKELQDNWQNAMVQQTLGWSPEEYKDYQYAIQAVSGTNPMSSSAYIKGKDKDGKIVKMTPQDWVDYWRKVYNTDERTDAFIKSYQSNDPYERTMALIMGQGKDTPVYGFDPLEQLGQGFAAFGNMVTKLPQGIMRIVGTDNTTKRIEEIGRNLSVPFASLSKIKVTNESDFNAKKEALKGKTWGELSDDDKAFLLILGASKESQNLNPATRDMVSGTKTSAGYRAEDLNKMSSDDAFISKQAIDNILVNNSYNDYKNAQDNFTTWQNYDEDVNQDDKRLEKNAIWSGASQWWGNIAGSMARYLWEAALIRAATGGINPKSITNPRLVTGDDAKALLSGRGVNVNAISDRIGDKLVETLGKHGISPASGFGKGMMDFTANLIGTIPEDILQTAIDNTLTYHSEDNDIFSDITNIPENFVNTFIWMAGLNALRVGKNAVARARLANAAKKAEFLNNKVNIDSTFADADEFSRAVKENRLKIDGDNVSIIDKNGNEKVLKDMDAKKAEIGRKIVNGEKVEAGLRKSGIGPEEKQPWSSTAGGWNERIRLERQYIKENSPINVDTKYTEGSVGEWLKDSRTKYDTDGNITVNGSDEFMRKWNELPVEVRDRILEDDNFRRLWDNYEPEAVAAHLGTDFPLLPEVIDDIYAEYLWKNRTGQPTAAESAAAGEPGYKFVKDNSPIDGIRRNNGSVVEWLAANDVPDDGVRTGNSKLNPYDEESLVRLNKLPSSVKKTINTDNNIQKMISKYGYSKTFNKISKELPEVKNSIDSQYANHLWESIKTNQPSAATTATTEPTAVEENIKASTEDINEGVKTSGTLQEKLLQKSKEIYDKRATSANKLKDEGMKQSSLKRAGMEKAARDRLITGELTGKERQALSDKYSKFFRGKDVIVDGQHAVVTNPSVYGRVKVEFDDGTTKVVEPADAKPQFTAKEDIDKDIFDKFIKKDIEQQLGVNLDEMSADTGSVAVKGDEGGYIDDYGVKVKDVDFGNGGGKITLDYEIADGVALLNKNGYKTFNSHSGIEADHKKSTDSESTGDGYIQFSRDGMTESQEKAIVDAAKKANMEVVYDNTNPVYGRTLEVRQSLAKDGTTRKEMHDAANEEVFKEFKVPKNVGSSYDKWGWLMEHGKSGEAFSRRLEIEKQLLKDHGGEYQPNDKARKDSWNKFFKSFGFIEEQKTPDNGNLMQRATKADAEPVKVRNEVPETKAPETEKIIVEDEGPNGKVMEEVTDYNFRDHRDALDAKIENPTRAEIKNFHAKALDATMNNYQSFIDRFHNKFGDVQVSDFDWVRHQTQQGLTPDQIIGTKDPTTGRMIDQNKIDAMKWWAEQPEVKDLREASLKAMGDDEDYNILGYLPHTDYDPSNMDYDDAMKGIGMLWQKSTGASVMKDGNYVGYGGTFENRYRTFASNMLWDAKSKDIAASKLIEDAMLDGRQMSPELVEEAKKSVEGGRKIDVTVEKAASTKDIIKGLSDKSSDIDWAKMEENSKKDGAKVGLGQAMHDNYTIYRGHNKKNVVSQPEKFASLSFNFDQLSNNLRKIEVADIGNLYENGAAAMINSAGDAYELTARVFREGKTLREGIVEYLQDVSKRSSESADYIADKWVARVLDKVDNPTIANVSRELSKCMYNEGFSRVRRFLSLAKYDQFNTATRNAIDQFLFNKMQTDAVKNSPKITKFVTKALNAATHLRYEALFYGNVKNALLQLSELSRLFTTFKWGDVAKMAKRLATDADFKTRVDIYVDAIAPKTDRLTSELYQKYANTAEGMEVKKDGVKFKDIQNKMDDVGLAPINAAEAYKNRMMIAALVQEADSHKLTGNEAMRYIRKRYERVALAADEMGRIGLSSNPFARVALFLQNFQIRELGMHYYNLLDEGAIGEKAFGKAGKAYNQIKYLGKVFGTKLATTLILARLGYSATQTLGIDPFGLMNDYNKLDEDEMNELDKQISHGVLTPLFSGGMTSLISDLYFMARKSYEDSVRDTVSDEAERNLKKPGLLESLNIFGQTKWDDALSFDRIMGDTAQNFIPGAMTAKRISQMNELMNTGWATSAKGNKMYTAPDDIVNTVLGYLFGRNATANANQYNQTYGDNLFQTIGRFNPFREWGDFDPIDDKNYTDWFKGNENDLQQFNKGIYYFRDRRDEIIDAYENAIRDSYSTADDSEAKNDMNQRLNELYDQLERFVKAYENKNGTITPTMVKQVINVLNTTRKNYQDTESEAQDRSTAGYADALSRYSSLDLPAVGTYTGPTEGNATKEVSYQGSPQWRTAISGYYDTADEAVAVLKEVDKKLSPIRKELKDAVSDAYTKKDWDALARIQKQYLKEFDNAVSPVIAAYGNSILKDTDVADQLRDMLSTGTNKKSANLIPSEQYAKNKYGKYQSMEYESVDVGKWAQKRFSGDTYTKPTITSNTSAAEDLSEIKKLIRRGQNDRARARALQLKVRVDNQTRSLSSEDYKWLESYLNYKEGK